MTVKRLTYFQALPSGSVDAESGTIKGVSVLTIGPALGHGIAIDAEGLKQCLEACQKHGSVKLIDRHDAEFEGIVGAITNFRIEGDQVKGDAELFENHPMRGRILEIAQKIPREFGLSIECDNKHIESPDGKGKLFRCSDVDAIALVPRPAANKTGLFSARPFDTTPKLSKRKMSKLKTALSNFAKALNLEEGDQLDNVLDAIVEAVQENQPSVEDRLKKLEDAAKPVEMTDEEKAKMEEDQKAADEAKAKEDEERMQKLAEKIAEEKVTKLASAMGISRAPSSGAGFVVADDKTKLSAELSAQKAAGAKSDAEAIFKLSRNKPEIYNEFRAKGLL